jgi:hypothetical protein
MPRVSIDQFRATLASRSEQGATINAYREHGRRPSVATGMRFGEWIPWGAARS